MRWKLQLNQYTLSITCADCVSILNAFTDRGIRLDNVHYNGDLVLRCSLAKADYDSVAAIAQKFGASIKVLRYPYTSKITKTLGNRPVLTVFAAIMLLLSVYLPSRVLFISVEGNTSIPEKRIIEAAELCGIRFGTSRRQIRSEKVKNELLQKIPQLQWAGINTNGCTAVISVKEKTTQKVSDKKENVVASIVASRDGIIQNCTVYQGNSLCSVGQAVKAGQTLVSGYVDCGIVTKASQADAEIKALTFRELEVVAPTAAVTRGELYTKKTNYCLQIGKKLIKIGKDSGNVDTTCVKIYTEKFLQFPGGFRLPVGIVKETCQYYYEPAEASAAASEDWLDDYARKHLEETMIAGQVVSSQTDIEVGKDAYYLYGRYACMEMIGRLKYEQMITKDDVND